MCTVVLYDLKDTNIICKSKAFCSVELLYSVLLMDRLDIVGNLRMMHGLSLH